MHEKEISEKKHNYFLITIVLFWSGLVIMSSMYVTIPLVSVFADTYQVTLGQSAWTSSIYSFCFAAGCLFYGPLSDKFGRKKIILLGLAALILATFFIGFTKGLVSLIILRGIQGAAAASFSAVALAYIGDTFPANKKVSAIGFISAGFLIAGITGQVLSSALIQILDWRFVFHILGVLYIVTYFMIRVVLPERESKNIAGNIITPFKQVGKLFKNRSLIMCYIIAIAILLSFVGMYATLENHLSDSPFSLSNEEILFVRSLGIIGMACTLWTGKLVERFGVLKVLRIGIILAATGMIITGFVPDMTLIVVMSIIFVSGIAMMVPSVIFLVGQLAGKNRGLAISLYTFILFVGASIGPILSIQLLKTGYSFLPFVVLGSMLFLSLTATFFINMSQNEWKMSRKNYSSPIDERSNG